MASECVMCGRRDVDCLQECKEKKNKEQERQRKLFFDVFSKSIANRNYPFLTFDNLVHNEAMREGK